MTVRMSRWSGAWPRAVLLAAVASFAPLPVAAAESAAPKAGPIRASVEKVVFKDTTAKAGRSGARRAAQSTPGQDSSFFRTKPGVIALVVMAVGAGYAIYSTQNDRIKSPGKE